jgi:bifunctional non-homologous end joining protein LigD
MESDAGRASAYQPQLATLVDTPPVGPEWLHELKYDGYRMGCAISGKRIALISRRGNDWTPNFPEIVRAARSLRVRSALLDGEVAILTPDGRTSFQALQNAASGGTRSGVVYFAFDLLELNGRDLRPLALDQRKGELEALLKKVGSDGVFRYSQHLLGGGAKVFRHACHLGAEGIVCKRRTQPYRPGRNRDWLKVKCVLRQDFVVGGFTDPEGSRQGVGALLLGYHDASGALVFAGKVGTGAGFTQSFMRALRGRLDGIEQKATPFTPRPPGPLGREAHWVRPELVAEVAFGEWTADGRVRHASFQGFREDMDPLQVRRELPQPAQDAGNGGAKSGASARTDRSTRSRKRAPSPRPTRH